MQLQGHCCSAQLDFPGPQSHGSAEPSWAPATLHLCTWIEPSSIPLICLDLPSNAPLQSPTLKGSSGANLPEISFNIQTEIYPYVPPVLASQPPSSKSSKCFQLLQLEESITVQVGFSFKFMHKKTFNLVLDKTSTAEMKAPSKLLYSVQKTWTPRQCTGGFCLLPSCSL